MGNIIRKTLVLGYLFGANLFLFCFCLPQIKQFWFLEFFGIWLTKNNLVSFLAERGWNLWMVTKI